MKKRDILAIERELAIVTENSANFIKSLGGYRCFFGQHMEDDIKNAKVLRRKSISTKWMRI